MRAAYFVFFHRCFNPSRQMSGIISPHIVSANQQHHDLRIDAIDLSLAQAPKQVLGAISLDTEVGRTVSIAGPHFLPGILPAVGDGITVEDDIGVLTAVAIEFLLYRDIPIFARRTDCGRIGRGGHGRVISSWNLSRGRNKSSNAEKEKRQSTPYKD